jgi:hypothetical protein
MGNMQIEVIIVITHTDQTRHVLKYRWYHIPCRYLPHILEKILYTQRYYIERYYAKESLNYQTFYGNIMNENYRKSGCKLIRDYNLVTFDNKEITVFSE